MSEKTEKPTAKRIRDARQDGQIAKSMEINGVIQLLTILAWMIAEAPYLLHSLADIIDTVINTINLSIYTAMNIIYGKVLELINRFVLTLLLLIVASLTLTGLLQSGFLFSPKSIQPKLDRLNIINNVKQMFSIVKLFEFVKTLLKVIILGIVFFYLIKRYAYSFAHLPQFDLTAGLLICSKMVFWMWSILLSVSAIFSIADYALQKYQLNKQLMMSHEDIKQEFKNSEGSQEIKHKRKELHQEIQSGSLASNVSKSSVVVKNPTHIAVCIFYNEGETALPLVLDYGKDEMALHILKLAEENEIPIVENIQLARDLIKSTKPGDYIPEGLFIPMAHILKGLNNSESQLY